MRTVLYTFSATGNSLTTAEQLAALLPDCEIKSVTAAKDQIRVDETADAVGFVFPVYYGDMPWPVRSLVSKMTFAENAYIFAVPTYRGGWGDVNKRLNQLLNTRGQKLSLSCGVPMPGNSFINEAHVDRGYLDAQAENVKKAAETILSGAVENYSTADILPLRPVDTPNNFRGITAEDTCIGCGTCVSVCPMGNITLQDGKAVIGDACCTCLACFHWCPAEAIWMSKQENIARRSKYHHPDVVLSDILALKR